MIDYKLEHIFTVTGTLAAPPEVIGPLPEGFRVNFYSSGGEITGPKLRGKVRAAGGDWLTVRKDGVGLLDVRTTYESHDGALILVTYLGLGDLGEDGYEKFARGEMPPVVPLKISPRFFTTHPSYVWMNRLHCLGVGEYHAAKNAATYDIYAVR